MKSFEVSGTFRNGEEWKPYTKVISAPNENQARERTFAVFGSKHRLERRYITVQSVKMINGE